MNIQQILNKFKGLLIRLKGKEYNEYITAQLKKTKSRYPNSKNNPTEVEKKIYLTNMLAQLVDLTKVDKAVVVGCRNESELDLLEEKGVKEVVGVDLFSYDPRIKVMDMHDLEFKDNTFDLVYASHVLEHSLDYKKVMSEFVRVLKDNGFVLIEVPVNYTTNKVDRHDLKSAENIISVFKSMVNVETLLQEDVKADTDTNMDGTDISRIVIKILK